MGPLEQILSGKPGKEMEAKANLMLRNSRRLLSLINQLLELSKFDSGAMKLQAARQNIVPFLKGTFYSFDSLAVQKELELIFQTEAEDISLYYDRVKMEEVITNLMSNALKFTPAGGRITLAVEVREAQPGKEGIEGQENLQLSVSDTGPGISREELGHIFDRFYQADSTYEYHRQGTGIGLAIAREIVELHHGTISAYSPGKDGAGTLFVILLPIGGDHIKPGELAESLPGPKKQGDPAPGVKEDDEEEGFETAEEEEETGQGQASQEKEIILVVEDSADVRKYIRGALVPQYIVKEAKDGDEGLSLAGEIVPDLVICDVMMPGKDGFEVCRGIKSDRVTSHIPVILLTAKAGEENIIQGLESGADDYITKPFSTRILSARIKNLIELRRQFQQNLSREMTLKPVKTAVSNIDREFLRDLQVVINENISDTEFNVEELSRKMYMSHANLYRKIHALTGENPTDFVRSCRLKRGAELLKNKSAAILEVALEVGFSSAAYFTKCFKEKFHQ
jgi:DNA-binding response OmpR family regulator